MPTQMSDAADKSRNRKDILKLKCKTEDTAFKTLYSDSLTSIANENLPKYV